jgi:hypothetical protein
LGATARLRPGLFQKRRRIRGVEFAPLVLGYPAIDLQGDEVSVCIAIPLTVFVSLLMRQPCTLGCCRKFGLQAVRAEKVARLQTFIDGKGGFAEQAAMLPKIASGRAKKADFACCQSVEDRVMYQPALLI